MGCSSLKQIYFRTHKVHLKSSRTSEKGNINPYLKIKPKLKPKILHSFSLHVLNSSLQHCLVGLHRNPLNLKETLWQRSSYWCLLWQIQPKTGKGPCHVNIFLRNICPAAPCDCKSYFKVSQEQLHISGTNYKLEGRVDLIYYFFGNTQFTQRDWELRTKIKNKT